MGALNLTAAWIGISLGFLSGAALGLKFHEEGWQGGYTAWPRRMMRLGHISFFGLALINLAYAISLRAFGVTMTSEAAAYLFILGAATMPVACFLSAWRKPLRHLFYVPVTSLCAGGALFLAQGGLL